MWQDREFGKKEDCLRNMVVHWGHSIRHCDIKFIWKCRLGQVIEVIRLIQAATHIPGRLMVL